MEMTNFTCPKCQHIIPIQNKILHELRCTGPSNEESNTKFGNSNNQNVENNFNKKNNRNPNLQNQNNQNPNQPNLNNQYPNQPNLNNQYPNQPNQTTQNPNQNINKKEEKTIIKTERIEQPIQLFTCDKCNQTMEMKEKEDHLLSHQLQEQLYNENREERKREEERLRERHQQQRDGRRIIRDNNGFTRESYEENLGNGNINIVSILRDPQGNIISRQENAISNNNNRNNNYNYNNNNNNNIRRGLYDDDDDSNGSHQIITDSNGNRVETITRNLPNGGRSIIKITKDRNGNIISRQEMNQMGGMNMVRNTNNNNNNMNMNMNMFDFDNFFRNYNAPNFHIQPLNMRNGLLSSFNDFGEIENLFNNNTFFSILRNSNFQGFMMPNNTSRPVNQRILNSLPEITLDDISKLDGEKKNCVICLENFKVGEKVIILPCIHIFHSICIKSWLTTKDECPMCKFKLTPENIERGYQ